MELNFDTENTVNCPDRGISTREECYDCLYFKMLFVDVLGGKIMILDCVWNDKFPELEQEMYDKMGAK